MRIDLRTLRGQRKYVNVEKERPPRFLGEADVGGGDVEEDGTHPVPQQDEDYNPWPAARQTYEDSLNGSRAETELDREGAASLARGSSTSGGSTPRAIPSQGQLPYPYHLGFSPDVNY